MAQVPSFKAPEYVVVFDGQSLNYAPDNPLGGADDYPHQLQTAYLAEGKKIPIKQVAIGGEGWYELVDNVTTRLDPYAYSGLTTILVMCGGTADYALAGGNDSGAGVYAKSWAYADAARLAGFNKVVCCTTTPASYIVGTQETNRTTGNGLILADALAKFDYTVDLEDGGFLSDVNDPTYYIDSGGNKVHWTTDGATVAMNLVKDKLDLIIV